MIKATAKSKDPVQQALRDKKSTWNKRVKVFIDNTINLKKMLNGHPSKFHMEKIDIKEPLPENPASILEALLKEFSEIAQDGNKIISDQANYSANRKNRSGKVVNFPIQETQPIQQPEVVEVDLEEQLSKSPLVADYKPQLISEASGRLSRFKAKLKGPWFGSSPEAIERKNRLALLDDAKDLYDLCGDFQVEVLSTDDSSINIANQLLLKIEDELISLMASMDLFVPKREVKDEGGKDESGKDESGKDESGKDESKKEDKAKAQPDTIPTVPPETTTEDSGPPSVDFDQLQSVVNDLKINGPQLTDIITDMPQTILFIERFLGADQQSQVIMAPEIMTCYTRALGEVSSYFGEPIRTLQQAVIRKTSAYEQIQILAEINVKKMLRRLRHKLPFAGKTSAVRVEAYEAAESMRKSLDSIMGSLEVSMDPDMLNPFTTDLLQQYDDTRKAVSILVPGEKYRGPDSILSEENQKRIKQLVQKRDMQRLRDRMLRNRPTVNKPGK